jgi:hypothetical protein
MKNNNQCLKGGKIAQKVERENCNFLQKKRKAGKKLGKKGKRVFVF